MNDSPRYRPERDARVSDVTRFLRDRQNEAEAMIALWERSRNRQADDELKHWRKVLSDVERQIRRIGDA